MSDPFDDLINSQPSFFANEYGRLREEVNESWRNAQHQTAEQLAHQSSMLGQDAAYQQYLQALDGMQGTTYRTQSIAELQRQIIEAELRGWQQGMNG